VRFIFPARRLQPRDNITTTRVCFVGHSWLRHGGIGLRRVQ
jgi:hypothetical protein